MNMESLTIDHVGCSPSRHRVAVVYHFYPHYRRAIVEALARSHAAEYTFLGDDQEYLASVEPACFSEVVRFEHAPTHHVLGPFMWQWRAISIAFDRRFDTVIFHPVPHWPCTWVGALLSRIVGKRVLFWGHGLLAPPRGLNGWIRRALNSLPHAHLLYGRRAKILLMQIGWDPLRLHVIHNSLDHEEQSRVRSRVAPGRREAVRIELFGDPATPVVACPSRLISMRRLDLLILALELLRKRGRTVNLILIGDGPEHSVLQRLASEHGVMVHFEGACYDEARLGELLMSSNVVASPGRVGLTVIHAMTFGIPVVSHSDPSDQAPEWEAIIPGQTGAVFEPGDVRALADALEPWLAGQFVDPSVSARCIDVVDRFWTPAFQRRRIDHAVTGGQANDLLGLDER